jgi:hypothetical protein
MVKAVSRSPRGKAHATVSQALVEGATGGTKDTTPPEMGSRVTAVRKLSLVWKPMFCTRSGWAAKEKRSLPLERRVVSTEARVVRRSPTVPFAYRSA